MNVLVVDTSAWISYFNGKSVAHLELALKEGRVYLSPIVAAELLSSRLTSEKREELETFLRELPVCDGSFDHWSRVGKLRAMCASKGIQVSTPDAHVAQCSLDLEGYLLTEDRIFKKLAEQIPLKLA